MWKISDVVYSMDQRAVLLLSRSLTKRPDWDSLHARILNSKVPLTAAIRSELSRRVRQAHAKEKRDAD